MDLRRLTLTLLGIAVTTALRGAAIQTYPLDERLVYTVRIARDEPTTCLFPAALTALEGGNVSAQAADTPPVLLSFQPGAAFFSVRALRDDAKAAINVVFRGKVFVLTQLRTAPCHSSTRRSPVRRAAVRRWRRSGCADSSTGRSGTN